jgi:hypothetical protein
MLKKLFTRIAVTYTSRRAWTIERVMSAGKTKTGQR